MSFIQSGTESGFNDGGRNRPSQEEQNKTVRQVVRVGIGLFIVYSLVFTDRTVASAFGCLLIAIVALLENLDLLKPTETIFNKYAPESFKIGFGAMAACVLFTGMWVSDMSSTAEFSFQSAIPISACLFSIKVIFYLISNVLNDLARFINIAVAVVLWLLIAFAPAPFNDPKTPEVQPETYTKIDTSTHKEDEDGDDDDNDDKDEDKKDRQITVIVKDTYGSYLANIPVVLKIGYGMKNDTLIANDVVNKSTDQNGKAVFTEFPEHRAGEVITIDAIPQNTYLPDHQELSLRDGEKKPVIFTLRPTPTQ